MKRVDLHIHTTASDGAWEPHDIADEVLRAGIHIFAITDHDSISGIKDALKAARQHNLKYIKGVEITSRAKDKICHILGYGIDENNPSLLKLCEQNTLAMKKLNLKQVESLIKKGFDINLDEFEQYTFDKKRGGSKVSNFLVDKGFFPSFIDALRFIAKNVEWISEDYPSPNDVISIIKSSGGRAVLAHPGSTLLGKQLTEDEIKKMVEVGLEGLECYSPYHSETVSHHFVEFCKARGLLITGGSDCHGPVLSRKLGEPKIYIEDLVLDGLVSDED